MNENILLYSGHSSFRDIPSVIDSVELTNQIYELAKSVQVCVCLYPSVLHCLSFIHSATSTGTCVFTPSTLPPVLSD